MWVNFYHSFPLSLRLLFGISVLLSKVIAVDSKFRFVARNFLGKAYVTTIMDQMTRGPNGVIEQQGELVDYILNMYVVQQNTVH